MLTRQVAILFSSSNPVFVRARQGRWIPNALVSSIVFALFVVVAFGGCALAILLITGDSGGIAHVMQGAFGLTVPFGLVTSLVLLWVRSVEKRSIATLGLMRAATRRWERP